MYMYMTILHVYLKLMVLLHTMYIDVLMICRNFELFLTNSFCVISIILHYTIIHRALYNRTCISNCIIYSLSLSNSQSSSVVM